MLLKDLANNLKLEFRGNGETEIKTFCSIYEQQEAAICFITNKDLAKVNFTNFLPAAVITPKKVAEKITENVNIIYSDQPMETMIQAVDTLKPKIKPKPEISKLAIIDPAAEIAEDAYIGPFTIIAAGVKIMPGVSIGSHCLIGQDTAIGLNCTIHSRVTIKENITIGNNCEIHDGTVIGADGFGYIPDPKLGLKKVPQVGTVILEDFVEIGSNTNIDRATFGSTRIGYGTKIDNQVQIGHNVQIGKFSLLCAKVGVSGSVKIGDQVVLGGAVGVVDHIEIGDKIRVSGGSSVYYTIKEAGDYCGTPAVPAARGRRNMVISSNLFDVIEKIKSQL